MLDSLSSRLQSIFDRLGSRGRLTEDNIQEALREVRVALLEADVNFKVVRGFMDRVREKAVGQDVLKSLTPAQQVVKVVHDELVELLGGAGHRLAAASHPPTVIMLMGLQGSGKTTTAGKLAKLLAADKKKVALVSCDVYRPAAIEQLKAVAAQAGADFIESKVGEDPVDIARRALEHAKTRYYDVLIVDSAGRLAIDEEMMREIAELHAALKPVETLFIVDAMQGQDAVNVARAFNERLPLTGVILTKLDGDARAGAALSVLQVTGKPIKFAGVGEKLSGIEPFHPERMAARILGMGDILGLVEEAHARIDLDEARRVAEKVKRGRGFDLEDFKAQIAQMKKMGGVAALLDKLPAQLAGQISPAQLHDDRHIRRIEGIINSMTPAERADPSILKASRKRRIAAGAGVPVQAVNQLLNQFEQMQKMMKMMKGGNMARMLRNMKGMLPGPR